MLARLVAGAVPASLLAYAVTALVNRWWLSGLAAPIVAWLLWRRHGRARFAAYVLLTAVLFRAVGGGSWWLAAYAIAALLTLQTAPARARWPRLRPGVTRTDDRSDGDRMARP